jgi:hypothetical protein
MADEKTCEVVLTLVPLTIGPYNDVMVIDFRKIQNSGIAVLCMM